MDAVLGNIFLQAQQRIASLNLFKFIDLDTGQLEYKKDDMRPAVLLPCALIDIIDIEYEQLSQNAQIASAVLQVRTGVDPFTQSTHYFSSPQIENALNYFNIEHNLNKGLHGWNNSQFFTELMRSRTRTELREDKLRVRVLHYKFTFNDDTAMIVPASTIARPDLDVDLTAPV